MVHAHPKSFDLLKIWATSLNIRVKMTPNIAWLWKTAPKVCRKNMKTFEGSHQKRLNDLCGREFVGKSCTKTSLGSLGKLGEISFASPNLCLLLNLRRKRYSPCCFPFENTEGWMPPPCLNLPASLCILFYRKHALFTRCCKLQFVTAININYQRYPKTAVHKCKTRVKTGE